jgi:phosphoribosylaminoimidazolecarboxamide formyltransferase/IMP cyclohydrolase
MAFNSVGTVQDLVPVRNIIISVHDKTGLGSLVEALVQSCPGLRIYSTGGSHDFIAGCLRERAARHLVHISDYTGQPEMKGGLVKTLDWKIYLGLLAETADADHAADLARTGAVAFDMVVGNLYPFGDAVVRSTQVEAVRQHIDIGGPAMLRAAAKNFLRVAAISHPGLYAAVAGQLADQAGHTSLTQRVMLAKAVFQGQAEYDTAVADYLDTLDADSLERSYTVLH